MALVRSIATIGGITAVSRVLGFARDVLIAAFLGAGPVADAFFVALRFPNMFRALFAEGAFSAAFVPLFVATSESDGPAAARTFAEQALSTLTLALLVFLAVMLAAMPVAMMALAPGFAGTPAFDLAVQFSRITFPYLLFISLTALLAGVLNSLGRFAAPAAAPILLNVVLVSALLVAPPLPTLGHTLSWAVAVAGVVQFLWLLFHAGAAGMWLRMPRPRLTPKVSLLLRRALPVAFGAGVYQVNILVGTMLASLLPAGSVSYLFYADRLNQLPFGILGAAVSTALLPVLSRHVRGGDVRMARHSQNRALEFTLLLMLPAAAALIVLAEPFIAVLFQRGAFTAEDVTKTAAALTAFAIGLPALLLIKALTPGFYAREDTSTPVRIAVVTTLLNVVLSIVLMRIYAHVGIALAASIAAWINAVALAAVLRRRGFLVLDTQIRRRLPRTLLSAIVMAGVLWLIEGRLGAYLDDGTVEGIAVVAATVAVGLAVFAVTAHVTGAARLADIRRMLRGEDVT
jgi:putative peptidoglycan lipid II flippase